MINLISLVLRLLSFWATGNGQSIAIGHLPVVLADKQGIVHLVYGQDSTIYYATYSPTLTVVKPAVAVATLPNLVASAKRGPQLAITDQTIVITAVNKIGDIFAYALDRRTGKWSRAVPVNDVPAIAKEGFQAVAGAGKNVFHAVWLDLRGDKRNKIMGAISRDGGRNWSANKVIYQSPDGSVCECCKVSVKASDTDVYVQFRNWLGGSRDLYLAHSTDGGISYAPARKVGTGTWKLNACPMDGGTVVLTANGPLTVWRRENTLYSCIPGDTEQPIANGRNVTAAAGADGSVMAWDENGMVWAKYGGESAIALGKGQMPSLTVVGQTAVCAWENEGQVMMGVVTLPKK